MSRHATSFPAVLFAAVLGTFPLAALAAEPSLSSQTQSMLTLAEELYPNLFKNGAATQNYRDYVYRAFSGGIYVGVRNERVYLLGGPFGSNLTEQGTVGSVLAMLQNIKSARQGSAGGVASTLYVDGNSGSDTSGDGSKAKPWKTIQKATTKLAPGTTIAVYPGVYKGPIVIDTKATEAAPATLKALAPGVIINTSGASRDAVFVDEASWIIIDGIKVQNATRAGLRVSQSPHVTVKNSTFVDNGTWGIFTDFSDYTTVEDCETARSGTQHGIYISNSSDFPVLRRNHSHHNKAAGIHMNGDISSGGDGIITGGLVEGNIIYENGTGGASGINMDGVINTTVRNNLLYDNHASGISVFRIDGGTFSSNNRLYNNTVMMASNGRWAINIPDAQSKDNKLFNNIIFHPGTSRGAVLIGANNPAGFESDYNVMIARFSIDDGSPIDNSAWQALGHDKHSVFTTPDAVFTAPQNKVFTLKQGSPALGAGLSLVGQVTDDLNGQARSPGPNIDIGAFELLSR